MKIKEGAEEMAGRGGKATGGRDWNLPTRVLNAGKKRLRNVTVRKTERNIAGRRGGKGGGGEQGRMSHWQILTRPFSQGVRERIDCDPEGRAMPREGW